MSLFRSKKSTEPEKEEAGRLPPWTVTVGYHDRTKHHFYRFAPSLGFLDWENQPNPFRRFEGAQRVPLPFPEIPNLVYDALYTPPNGDAHLPTFENLAVFLEHSLAISAWKQYRSARWALRCNPSSGNLHPTEGYILTGSTEGLSRTPAVFHYGPEDHALEHRAEMTDNVWRSLTQGFPSNTFFAGLTSIHWREAWKYGERAYRYCQHDVGHALAAITFAARLLDWRVVVLDQVSDRAVATMLGVDREADFPNAMEREHPALIAAVITEPIRNEVERCISEQTIAQIASADWRGKAEMLSSDHVHWEAINAASAACEKPSNVRLAPTCRIAETVDSAPLSTHCGAASIIRQRRSAVDMDGETGMTRGQFYAMLSRVMHRPGLPLWDALGEPAYIHLALFVHRVDGLPPGLYALPRSKSGTALRHAMEPTFKWERPPECPGDLPLALLREGDVQSMAASLSCQQAIAGDGAFSLGMLAEFQSPLENHGAWIYRRLFWEAGVIGQVLYLEAEAAGLRATGIGCYFDDPVHEAFGLNDRRFQSLYHFTVGGAVDDPRLTTWPPYNEERGYTRRA